MPLKRKRRASPPPKGLAPGELLKRFMLPSSSTTPWSWVGSDVLEPEDITQEHMLTAYGFTPKSGFLACKNKYASITRTEAANSVIPVDEDGDVIVISDDEENPQCSKKLCKSNPRCLNYLGQDAWEDEGRAEAMFVKHAESQEDPMLLSRDPDSPVGLKNLGATCYANSSLQVWFRDLAFRNSVYQCQVPNESPEKLKDSPIFQLQVTFAALQEGRKSVFNPTKLVESLQLKTTEQQDAQEFSKLFMSHLDAEFKKQSDPAVQGLVESQFQGSQVYGMLCHTCKYRSERPSDFLEIEVNFKANCRLEDRIESSLQPEILSGDNQYFCPQCNSLQDATRYTELRQLPPVLHFSLLRFVYDLATMERKKSKHVIGFPTILDMSRFVGKNESEQKENPLNARDPSMVYELRGVLLHKGGSAYHGHYEAQVYDTQYKSWFQFNDESVKKISLIDDQKSGNKTAVDTSSEQEKRRRNPKKRRRIEDSDDEQPARDSTKGPDSDEIIISSKDAYMLVYMRRDSSESAAEIKPPSPPSGALQVVRQSNEEHESSCEEHEKRVSLMKSEFQQRRRLVMSVYHNWQVDTASEDEALVISQQALKDWLSKHCFEQCLPQNKIAKNGSYELVPCTISNADIVCEHKKLNPDKASEMKMITRDSHETIARETQCQFIPFLKTSDICEQCILSTFKERLYAIQHPRTVKDFELVQEAEDDESGYWISKPWLKDWKLQKPRMHQPTCEDPAPDVCGFFEHVTCDHGGIIPNPTHRKRISAEAKEILQRLYPTWDPPPASSELCPMCQASISMSKEDKRELRRKAEDEKAKLKSMNDMAFRYFAPAKAAESCAIIPSDFFTSWKRWVDGPTSHLQPGEIDTESLLCAHSMLLYDPNSNEDLDSAVTVIRREEWEILTTLYTAGPSIFLHRKVSENSENPFTDLDHAVCSECRLHRKMDWETAEIYVQLGKKEEAPANGRFTMAGNSGFRHSRRLRKKEGDKRKITVGKSTTVKDIKIEISDLFDIPTICQRLLFDDKELADNKSTVEELGIPAHETIYLEQINEAMEIDSDTEPTPRRKPREEGQGFSGTILGGSFTDSSRASSRADTPSSLPPAEKACGACTFVNPVDAVSCEMCETAFE
ncbi:cysteine proteinase [Coprinopsis marcescibilis]|uniref:Cysteine proteinase n=1 Tax=Coprinopsis marcescibilis TaxID=230819 RepID=A0A5C3LBV3_COPMA|nr:cysteine proteinase [Coprinopsis marcescibilis]